MSSSLGIAVRGGVGDFTDGEIYCARAGAPRGWRPCISQSGRLVLFSGSIDNRESLCAELGLSGAGDDRLYAVACDTWGEEADLKIVGQYAAILVDPDRKRVRAARSPIMASPLHVWRDETKLIAASVPRAIFASGEVRPEVDEQKIADSLLLNYEEEIRSWHKGIMRVPLGTAAEFRPGTTTLNRYYDPAKLPAVRFPRDSDYVEAANQLLADGVKSALRGSRKPAILLSGGYDSQAVAAHAMRLNPSGSLFGFTGVPEEGWDGRMAHFHIGDESPFAEALARMYPGLEVEKVDASGQNFDDHLQKVFLLGGIAPRNATNFPWIFASYDKARARGCDVMLNGGFGNVSFSFTGQGAFPSWFKTFRWLRLVRELSANKGRQSLPAAFVAKVLLPLLPSELWKRMRELRGHDVLDPLESWCPINPAWAEEMRVFDRAKSMGFDPHFRGHLRSTLDWRIPMIERGYSEGGDLYLGLDTLYGVETRDPTAYRPLVEFCLSIPDDQYLRNGEFRWLARRMLKGIVPDSVLDERRVGRQGADWHYRLGRQRHALRNELEQLGKDATMARRLDIPPLIRALDNWPEETPLQDEQNMAIAMRLELAVTRAVTTARFIRFVEGTNS